MLDNLLLGNLYSKDCQSTKNKKPQLSRTQLRFNPLREMKHLNKGLVLRTTCARIFASFLDWCQVASISF